MLERYFIRPVTIDRIRACWIGDAIERYVTWLAENDYAHRNVFFRVPVLVRFEFAHTCGASRRDKLPAHVEPFVQHWLKQHGAAGRSGSKQLSARPVRNAIRQLLHLIIPNHPSNGRCRYLSDPFAESVPHFFEFLRKIEACEKPRLFSTGITCGGWRTTFARPGLHRSPICRRR